MSWIRPTVIWLMSAPDSEGHPAPGPDPQRNLPVAPQPAEGQPRGRQPSVVAIQARRHRGPLPSPEAFQGYKEVDASAPGRILAMAERQQEHDNAIALLTLKSEASYRTWGIVAAVAVVGVLAAGAVACALAGQREVALGLVAVGFVSVAGVFVQGRNLTAMQAEKNKPDRPSPPAQLDAPRPPDA